MSLEYKNIQKICNFHVSDWHMLTTVLSYLKQESIYLRPIAFISEKNLKTDFNFLLSKLNLNSNTSSVYKRIPWYDTTNNLGICNNSIYVVSGSLDYIREINTYLEKVAENNNINNVVIINCYESFNKDLPIKEIIEENDKMLTTSGIKEFSSVFKENSKKL